MAKVKKAETYTLRFTREELEFLLKAVPLVPGWVKGAHLTARLAGALVDGPDEVKP